MSAGFRLETWKGGALPEGLAGLVARADAEGYLFLTRLGQTLDFATDDAGERPELLILARQGAILVGIGALTADPYDPAPERRRLRHVYVCPEARRQGAGRRLGEALIAGRGAGIAHLTLRAADARAAAFWEAMGFAAIEHPNRTHERRFAAGPT